MATNYREKKKTKGQPPALSREANMDVTKTAKPPPMLKCPTLQQKKKFTACCLVLVYIANFALRDNCEGVNFFLLIRLNYIKS